ALLADGGPSSMTPSDHSERHGDAGSGFAWPEAIWSRGFLFAQALTIGGGTSEVQRNIVAERVLGLPHDIDVEAGRQWSQGR
ncbi:MAG: acyl-CoA dehydrogenase family protein, partial [Acidimicrobiales bacterium]